MPNRGLYAFRLPGETDFASSSLDVAWATPTPDGIGTDVAPPALTAGTSLGAQGGPGGLARTSGPQTTTAANPTLSASSTPFTIQINWDSSVTSLKGTTKTNFENGVLAAVNTLEATFTDPITIHLNVGYGEFGGLSLPRGAIGASNSRVMSVTYGQLLSALTTDRKSADDVAAVESLNRTVMPTQSSTYWVTTAEAKALGITSASAPIQAGTTSAIASAPPVDGFVGFTSSALLSPDFQDVVIHEITETMGRLMLVGGTIGPVSHSFNALDLFHYTTAGVPSYTTTGGYFSVDGTPPTPSAVGGYFNTGAGDAGDWVGGIYDAFSASATTGINPFSAIDQQVMDAIGWDREAATQTLPTGVAFTPATWALSADQSGAGVLNGALATIMETGGSATTANYACSLNGTGGGAFTVTSGINGVTLTANAAASPIAYGLIVTAGLEAAPAAPNLDIVVGGLHLARSSSREVDWGWSRARRRSFMGSRGTRLSMARG
jgi:hypothetical protein